MNIHGFHENAEKFGPLRVYGSDAVKIQSLARSESLGAILNPALPYTEAEVVWASRYEMARTIDDILSRRTRALFLNAKAALAAAPRVAELMAHELGKDSAWQQDQLSQFTNLAQSYLIDSAQGHKA
jgi:glycerol-3-phosphate dehydrogenase